MSRGKAAPTGRQYTPQQMQAIVNNPTSDWHKAAQVNQAAQRAQKISTGSTLPNTAPQKP